MLSNQKINTKDQLLFLMICWELETVLKQIKFSREEDMKIWTSITVRAVLVYRDKALEITVIE